MTELNETEKYYILKIKNQDKLNVSQVYNRHFFELFGFTDFHVNHFGDSEPLQEPTSKKQPPLQGSISLEEDESDLSIATELLGREKYPNGYSTLPLKVKGGNSFLNSMEQTLTRYYDKYRKDADLPAITKETHKEEIVDPSLKNKDVKVSFPKSEFKVEHLPSLLQKNEEYIDKFPSSMEYYDVEKVIKDVIFQLDYLENEGVIYSSIDISSVYRINGRYVILDSDKLVLDKRENQTLHLYSSLYKFFLAFMGYSSGNFVSSFIPFTNVYYCLQRLNNENVLIWI
tara:strand:- start:108 stop:965 length:858 start_codon:yes stop_codon:yes gene_type:complete